jgi:caffeoyl-CoA O-methyltransferase
MGVAVITIVPRPIEDYCRDHTTPAGALLDELAAYTREHCQSAQMLTGPVEGAFLRLLVQVSCASRVLRCCRASIPAG